MPGCVVTKQILYGSLGAASGGCGFGIDVLKYLSSAYEVVFHRKDKESNTDEDNNKRLLNIYYVSDIQTVQILPPGILMWPWEVR